jgi:hypothetical protein
MTGTESRPGHRPAKPGRARAQRRARARRSMARPRFPTGTVRERVQPERARSMTASAAAQAVRAAGGAPGAPAGCWPSAREAHPVPSGCVSSRIRRRGCAARSAGSHLRPAPTARRAHQAGSGTSKGYGTGPFRAGGRYGRRTCSRNHACRG